MVAGTATIDLTSIGTTLEETWYLGLLGDLTRQLHLPIDPSAWWQERSWQPTVQRFIGFLRDVVLTEIQEQVVIFIDEIDSTLRLDFSDDFFAAIRAVYNARAQEPTFERLTFVLLGVASPPDLIQDRTRTPFNIGQGILLQDFSLDDAAPLQTGLEKEYPDQSEAIFTRIYHWTDGHPYLTQKLCKEVVKGEEESWTNEQIDELVERTFLSDKALKEENLQFVRNQILTHSKQRQLLGLYRKVYEGQKVADDAQSPLQTQLKLSGLVKAQNGHLQLRNRIYRHVFDLAWISKNTATDWVRVVAVAAVLLVVLLFGVLAQSTWAGIKDQEIRAKFHEPYTIPTERVALLAELFQLQAFVPPADYDYRAKELFYSLSRDKQLALFKSYTGQGADLIIVVKGLYITLADVDQSDRTRPLLEVMVGSLNKLDETQETTDLQNEINSWLQGRAFYRQNQYTEARTHYKEALNLNRENPATLYERARVLTELSKYEEALEDLELVLVIAKSLSVPATLTPVSETTPSQTAPAFTPISRETLDVAITPTELSAYPIPYSTPTPYPYPTSNPSPHPPSGGTVSAITSEFDVPGKMIGAIKNFIQNKSELVDALASAPTSQYTNLRGVVLLPTVKQNGMVQLFVPAGEFLMGSLDDEPLAEDHEREKPQRTVYLDGFWIDQTEVTVGMFARFVEETNYETYAESEENSYVYQGDGKWEKIDGANWKYPQGPDCDCADIEIYPVVHVSWNDARKYCEWAGRRLPTEAEWEKAARGSDGRIYPWGNQEIAGHLVNFCDNNCPKEPAERNYDDGYPFTAPVGSYPDGASPVGALDMVGNVWEWVADWYDGNYYSNSPTENPLGPEIGEQRVLRGGSWSNNSSWTRTALRHKDPPADPNDERGFRCASDP